VITDWYSILYLNMVRFQERTPFFPKWLALRAKKE